MHSSCVSNPHAFAWCSTASFRSLHSHPTPLRPSSPAIAKRLTCREASVVVARFVPLPSLGCELHNPGGDRCREGKRPSRSHGCGSSGGSWLWRIYSLIMHEGAFWTLPRNPTDKLPSDVGGAGKKARCIGCDGEVGYTVICGTGMCPGRRRR